MNRIFISLLFIVIGTTLIMCSGEQKQEAATHETTETVVADTSKAICPGCSMEMDKAQMISSEVDGETHYYCSEMCKENHLSKKKDNEKKEM